MIFFRKVLQSQRRPLELWTLFSSLLFLFFSLIKISPSVLCADSFSSQKFFLNYLVDSFENKTSLNDIKNSFFVRTKPLIATDNVVIEKKKNQKNGLPNHYVSFSCRRSDLENFSVGRHLNGLDISIAENLSFYLKITGLHKEDHLFLTLIDEYGSKNTVNLDTFSLKQIEGWQNYSLPIEFFRSVDLNFLRSFVFSLKLDKIRSDAGVNERIEMCLDDIQFSATASSDSENVSLLSRSIMDNLLKPLSHFSEKVALNRVEEILALKNDHKFLREVAKDTWNFFESVVDKRTYLILDRIDVDTRDAKAHTSITNISFQLMAYLGATELGFISKSEALSSILKLLHILGSLKTWNGFWYNFYSTSNVPSVSREYISTVDNGWITCALFVIRSFVSHFSFSSANYDLCDQIKSICSQYLMKMDYSNFYSKNRGQMNLGYDVKCRSYSNYHYGLIVSEARMASFLAIAKGDVPRNHWFRVYRVLPKHDTPWRSDFFRGFQKEREGTLYYQGYYHYNNSNLDIVPSWGGSLFEFLMPTLFIDERNLSREGFALNNRKAIQEQLRYAKRKGYPFWGFSPCSDPLKKNGYAEYGISTLSTQSYPEKAVVTPHVSFLSLGVDPENALKNLRKMLKQTPQIYGEYGFYDSMDMDSKKVSRCYLSLDKGMEFVALVNYLTGGFFRKLLHKDPSIKKVADLLSEKFFLN